MALQRPSTTFTTSIAQHQLRSARRREHLFATRDDAVISSFPRSRLSVYSYSRAFRSWLRGTFTSSTSRDPRHIQLSSSRGRRCCQRASVPYLVIPRLARSIRPGKHRLLKRVAVGPLLVRPMLARARRVVVASDFEKERLHTYVPDAESR